MSNNTKKLAEENLKIRTIVKELNDFGLSERERIFLVYQLSLELENVQLMQELCATIKELSPDAFIAPRDENG
jgi:hypothetical protein